MKKLSYLIVLTLILGLVLTGCFLSNVGQVPTNEQSGITYLTKSPGPGLVGLWHFDEGSGITAYDSSGNNNHGTLKPTGLEPTWGPGYFSNALSFDGTDDYVGCGTDTSLNITNAITVEAWVKPSAFLTNPDHSTIATKSWAYYFQVDGDGYLQVYQYGTSPAGYHSSTNPILLNVWQHVAYTYDGSNVKIFINGYLDTTIPVTGTIDVYNGHLGIGMNLDESGNPHPTCYRQFQGEIDEVRIWNEALSSEDIFNLPAISVEKDGPNNAAPSTTVTYTYKVTNAGDCALSGIVVSDDLAGTAIYVSGDTTVVGLLELGETWIFTANYTIPTLDPLLPEYVENLATASGSDEFGIEVTATDTWRVHTMCARTIGYWKNCLEEDWCDLPEGSIFDDKNWDELLDYFPGNGIEEDGVNPLEMLRVQLLAAELNVACFDLIYDYSRYEEDIDEVITEVEVFLSNCGQWPIDKKEQRDFRKDNADELALKDVLDTFNNMGDECFPIEEVLNSNE